MRYYRVHFKDKIVFCNCDDPFESNFFKYFVLNFNRLGLKKLIATCYASSPIANTQLSLFDVIGTEESRQNKPYKAIFPKMHKEKKGLPWGLYYNEHGKRTDLATKALELEIQRLMGDEDVTKKSGIYEYLLTGEEKKRSIRAFDRRDALATYEKQHHKCAICGEEFEFEDMHADHIKSWSKGGHTTPENCQILCRDCNLKKGNQ